MLATRDFSAGPAQSGSMKESSRPIMAGIVFELLQVAVFDLLHEGSLSHR
jgi:hypothetical protein